MKDYTISQQYALVGFDGVESTRMTLAKNAVCRGIWAAKLLEELLFSGREQVFPEFETEFKAGLEEIISMDKKAAAGIEKEMAELLKMEGAMEEVQDLIACDINYETNSMDVRAYRSRVEDYRGITERLRAEMLEEGEVTLESVCLLWLLRESGCIHNIFSVKEQEELSGRMMDISREDQVIRLIWESEFSSWMRKWSQNLLNAKKNLFKNPYLEGVNLLFPFLDRRKSIFIDFVVLGTDVKARRQEVVAYLTERGHFVEEIKNGTETLLKVDNGYYRIFPMTRVYFKVPVQGASLVPVYK